MYLRSLKDKPMPISVPRPDPDAPVAALITATARQVLLTEAAAVRKLADHLPADFIAAVLLILASKGRVILSGIGKSGHIARKIAATLSSTGTPAFFVHPAEASHGDMGTITPADICILLSNSGETTELGDLIAHTRRFAIPLIGISGRLDSTLMQAADLRLELVDAPASSWVKVRHRDGITGYMRAADVWGI